MVIYDKKIILLAGVMVFPAIYLMRSKVESLAKTGYVYKAWCLPVIFAMLIINWATISSILEKYFKSVPMFPSSTPDRHVQDSPLHKYLKMSPAPWPLLAVTVVYALLVYFQSVIHERYFSHIV